MIQKREIIHIEGMHCRSCELLVEKNLTEIPGVKKAKVSHRKGTAEVFYDESRVPRAEALDTAVRDAGYRIGTPKTDPWITRDPKDYFEIVMAILSAFILFVLLDMLGVFNFSFDFGSKPALPIVFLVGLAAGISTCMALVGGLVLSMSARYAELHPESSLKRRMTPALYFNLGRFLSFAVLGGAIGALGSAFKISGSFIGLFIAAAGIVMLWLGIQLTELFPRLSNFAISLPSGVGRALHLNREGKGYSNAGSFVTGALTFFVPCGFTQAMQIYAVASGSFVEGSLIMLLFALGTSPGLFSAGAVASFARGRGGKLFFKFVGVVVIAFAIFNVSNGLTVGGFIDRGAGDEAAQASVEGGVQIVRMEQGAGGYSPNRFTVKKGVPVRWVIDSKNPYSCAAYLVVPKLNITKFLEKGENVIEFVPAEAGRISFSCTMGMYSGSFDVID